TSKQLRVRLLDDARYLWPQTGDHLVLRVFECDQFRYWTTHESGSLREVRPLLLRVWQRCLRVSPNQNRRARPWLKVDAPPLMPALSTTRRQAETLRVGSSQRRVARPASSLPNCGGQSPYRQRWCRRRRADVDEPSFRELRW